ncbi:MAG: hypothetical protein ACI9MC_001890 [Kiritimatiellia bacterium]|jgi:hypothetical protein
MRALIPLILLAGCAGATDDDTDDTPTVDPGPFVAALGDPEDCSPSIALKPPSEAYHGKWLAARLTPPAYPARVDSITIRFDGRVPCTLGVEGLVRVAVGGADAPSEPGVIGAASVDPGSGPGGQIYTLGMAAPPILQQGDHVWVHTQILDDAGSPRCVTLCTGEDSADRAFWSDTDKAPYTWTSIAESGASGSVAMSMEGEVLPAE